MLFIKLRKFPFIYSVLSIFIMKGVGFLSNAYSVYIEMTMWPIYCSSLLGSVWVGNSISVVLGD